MTLLIDIHVQLCHILTIHVVLAMAVTAMSWTDQSVWCHVYIY